MYVLGINAYHGDASAAIIKDGELLAAVEEERFNRCKHYAGFPAEAIKYCLDIAGISIEEVEYIGISKGVVEIFYERGIRDKVSAIFNSLDPSAFDRVSALQLHMGEMRRTRVEKYFSDDANVPSVMGIYRRALNGGGQRYKTVGVS